MTSDDLHDLIYDVIRKYSNKLTGISLGSRFSFDDDCFTVYIGYTYGDYSKNQYTEKLPNYLLNFQPQSAMKHIETALRNLITRSFRVEVNHLFGQDFNPL